MRLNRKKNKTGKVKNYGAELPLPPAWDYEAGLYSLTAVRPIRTCPAYVSSVTLYFRGRELKELLKMEWSSCCELADFLHRRFPKHPPPMEISESEREMMKSPAERMKKYYTSDDPDVARFAASAAAGHLFKKPN